MKTVASAVRSLFQDDEVVREAARRGILNSSAYAREITSEVEDLTWKDVEESTVVVAINRIAQEQPVESLKPSLVFERVSVETGLVDVTFDRTEEAQRIIQTAISEIRQRYSHDLFIETSGQSQITMIMTQRIWEEFQENITVRPLAVITNQIAVSLSFDRAYLAVPNFIYGVLGIFALDSINITEIFSTMTEIVIVVDHDALDTIMARVKRYMK